MAEMTVAEYIHFVDDQLEQGVPPWAIGLIYMLEEAEGSGQEEHALIWRRVQAASYLDEKLREGKSLSELPTRLVARISNFLARGR